jgi:hypothetical protein
METQQEYYYTYYSYEEYGRGYFGSRGCKCLPEKDVKYFGSFKDKTFRPTQKIILKDDYATREEAIVDEIILHDYYDVANNPHFANKAKQTSTKFSYIMSKEEAIKGGERAKELGVGIHSLTKEELREIGKKAGKIGGKIGGPKTYELGIGLHGLAPEQRTENGKRGAKKAKELGVGIVALTTEQLSENGKKGGERTKELGVGFFTLTDEERKELGRRTGKKCYENGTGLYGRTKEQRMEDNIKGGKVTGKLMRELGKGIFALTTEQRSEIGKKYGGLSGKQRWKCTETGYINNAGNLSKYQRARGIDTSLRERIS